MIKMNEVDLTYSGKLRTLINVIDDKKLFVNYTIEGKSKKVTTTSILINDGSKNKNDFLMITFNYQDLKKLVGDKENE